MSAMLRTLVVLAVAVLASGSFTPHAEAFPFRPFRPVMRTWAPVRPPVYPVAQPYFPPNHMPGWDWKYQYPSVFYNTHGYWPNSPYSPYYPYGGSYTVLQTNPYFGSSGSMAAPGVPPPYLKFDRSGVPSYNASYNPPSYPSSLSTTPR